MDGQTLSHHVEPGLVSTSLIRRGPLDRTPCRRWQRDGTWGMVLPAVQLEAAQSQKTKPPDPVPPLAPFTCHSCLSQNPSVPSWDSSCVGNIPGGTCSSVSLSSYTEPECLQPNSNVATINCVTVCHKSIAVPPFSLVCGVDHLST